MDSSCLPVIGLFKPPMPNTQGATFGEKNEESYNIQGMEGRAARADLVFVSATSVCLVAFSCPCVSASRFRGDTWVLFQERTQGRSITRLFSRQNDLCQY